MPEEYHPAGEFDPEVDIRLPPFPTLVTLAGIIWIGFGCLIILTVGLVFLFVVTKPVGKGIPEPLAVLTPCGGLAAFFGVAFLFVGVQSVRGTARDTLGNAIGSLTIGLLNLGFFFVHLGFPSVDMGQIIGALINAIFGLGLTIAGILALVGRGDYRTWRKAQKALHAASKDRRIDEDIRPSRLPRDQGDERFRA